VFFLYAPFTDAALGAVVDRFCTLAERRSIVVCALGIELPRDARLIPRATDSFWLTIYDGGPSRARRGHVLGPAAAAIANER
jgi:hypothetical protein